VDTDQLRTFLEVNRTRHFGQAAQNLFLSQSAVSARIHALEQQLGTPLFIRARNDIQLTPAGHRLVGHAENILAAWNRAKHELVVDPGSTASLAVAGVPSLWDILLQRWLLRLHQYQPAVAIHGETGDTDTLLRRLLEGTLDLCFTFDAPHVARIENRQIATISLVLVSSSAGKSLAETLGQGYIHVDWGLSFAIAFAHHFPDAGTPRIRLPLGRIALDYLLAAGGSAYLAETMVEKAIVDGRLFRVADAPVIERPAYALFSTHFGNRSLIDSVLDQLV